jgi:hypothetical protein
MSLRRNSCFYLILILCLSTAACSASLFRNYGQINPNGEVTRAFEGYQINPEFHYYISGADINPNALIGLHRDYRLDPSTLWRQVAISTARMKEIVEGMKTKAHEFMMFQYGFEMSDNNGKPIGVWYSILSARTFLRMNDDGTVRIDTPNLDTYEKKEKEVRDSDD